MSKNKNKGKNDVKTGIVGEDDSFDNRPNKRLNELNNLRKPLQHLKRVHIKSSFVLTFKYIGSEDKVVFYYFDHHDNIYR